MEVEKSEDIKVLMPAAGNTEAALTKAAPMTVPERRMFTFSFRAECPGDALCLCRMVVARLSRIGIEIPDYGKIPDAEGFIETDMDIEEVREAMRQVPDGHVMLQTVALTSDYTGFRDHSSI